MRAPETIALAVVFMLVSIGPSQAQSRRTPAVPPLPHQAGGLRVQQQLLVGPRTAEPSAGAQAQPSTVHIEMPQRGARPLSFPSPAPSKTPEYNPLILRHEA